MAMKRYKWLLFDLDGTIIFSHPGIFSCAKKALQEMGEKADYSDEFLRQMVGPPLEYTFEFMFGLPTERALEATRIYRKHYAVTGVNENELIPGMKEALCTLQKAGYILGMATSKPQRFAYKNEYGAFYKTDTVETEPYCKYITYEGEPAEHCHKWSVLVYFTLLLLKFLP